MDLCWQSNMLSCYSCKVICCFLICYLGCARSQCEESHPWQGHAAEIWWARSSQISGFPPGISWACNPQNKNMPALLYCTFPLSWHTLEKVISRRWSSAIERVFQCENPSDGFLACLKGSYSCACDCWGLPTAGGTGSLKHPRTVGASEESKSLE